MKRYKVTKIVYANSLRAALNSEKDTEPVDVCLDQEVEAPEEERHVIGFKKKK